MLARDVDVEIVGVAEDYDELVAGASSTAPDVVVSDIRMPPNFQREGIDAAKEIRKRHPGTGIVILSQFDDPDYAVSLLSEGSAGYAYLLKDRIAEGDQLARAIREVATGGSMLDPVIVSALMNPVRRTGGLTAEDDRLLEQVAAGRTIKAIAGVERSTTAAVEARVERLFLQLAEGVSAGEAGALDRLRRLHQAIVEREEQGETLSRLLPTGIGDQAARRWPRHRRRRSGLDVTVLMSDIRGYTTIAEHADPAVLAQQLNRHRAEMNRAILGAGGTVMQYVGDAVMAVFGAPEASRRPRRRAPSKRLRPRCTPPSTRQRRVGGRRARPVRARHRSEHRRRRRRPARQRGTSRVHARRRRRKSLPAAATIRRTRADCAQRSDLAGARHTAGGGGEARAPVRQGS